MWHLTRVTRSTNLFQCKIVRGRCKFNQTHARRILLSFHREVFPAVYSPRIPSRVIFPLFISLAARFSRVGPRVTRNYVQISQLMSAARMRKAVKHIRSLTGYFDARHDAGELIERNLLRRIRVSNRKIARCADKHRQLDAALM